MEESLSEEEAILEIGNVDVILSLHFGNLMSNQTKKWLMIASFLVIKRKPTENASSTPIWAI